MSILANNNVFYTENARFGRWKPIPYTMTPTYKNLRIAGYILQPTWEIGLRGQKISNDYTNAVRRRLYIRPWYQEKELRAMTTR